VIDLGRADLLGCGGDGGTARADSSYARVHLPRPAGEVFVPPRGRSIRLIMIAAALHGPRLSEEDAARNGRMSRGHLPVRVAGFPMRLNIATA
jgi:hypothetical protein